LVLRDGNIQLFGDQLDVSNHTATPEVTAMAMDEQSNLVVGGQFDLAGNTPANNLASWNGQNWENLGSGIDGFVSSITVINHSRLFVGGGFNLAGGKVSSYFAQLDEPFYQWMPVIDN
jgi:hypothetical protein